MAGSTTRYGWPVLVAGARACVLALRQAAGDPGRDAAGRRHRPAGPAARLRRPVRGLRPGPGRPAPYVRRAGRPGRLRAGWSRWGPAQGRHQPPARQPEWRAGPGGAAGRLGRGRRGLGGRPPALPAGSGPDRCGRAPRWPPGTAKAPPCACAGPPPWPTASGPPRSAPRSPACSAGPVPVRPRPRPAARGHAGASGATGAEAAQPFGLTARELEVLQLVAAGRSNREIAAELFISAKTASVHVSNILSKLSVASRGEAAATAYQSAWPGLGPSPRPPRPDGAPDRPRAAGLRGGSAVPVAVVDRLDLVHGEQSGSRQAAERGTGDGLAGSGRGRSAADDGRPSRRARSSSR